MKEIVKEEKNEETLPTQEVLKIIVAIEIKKMKIKIGEDATSRKAEAVIEVIVEIINVIVEDKGVGLTTVREGEEEEQVEEVKKEEIEIL